VNIEEELVPLIEEKLKFLRMELYDLKFIPAGRHSILRIFIDKEGGVTIDDCERASQEISMLLDVEDFLQTPYTLEVSSPGADRVLRNQKDYAKVVGLYVRVELKSEEKQKPVVVGKCLKSADNVLTLELDNGTERAIPLDTIIKGTMDIRFK
jgi:ribosome maturation factor RimP